MLRKVPIIFLCLTFSAALFAADKPASLYLQPTENAKIIGAIRNTDIMVLLENQGEWSKVIDVETGMVGWLASSSLHATPDTLSNEKATPQ